MNRQLFLLGLNIFGVISLSSFLAKDGNNLGWKIFRITSLISGTTAGIVLLREYRTPTKLEREKKQIDEQKTQLEIERERLLKELEEQRTQDILLNQQTEQRLQEILDSQQKSFIEQYESMQLNYQQAIAQYQYQLQLAQSPKMPTGIRRVDYLSRCVLEVLTEFGALCDYEDAHLTPQSFILWLSPREGIKVADCKKALENLPARLKGLYGTPDVIAADGYIEVTLPLSSDEEKLIAKRERDEKGIKPEPLNWFDRVIMETHHYFVSGKTGSGKSVLVNNIACRALTVLMEQDNGKTPEIIIIDPKFGQSSAWEFHGKKIIPQYQNYRPDIIHKTFKGNCPEGILEMGKITRQRLDEGAAAARDEIVLEKPNSVLFIADEAADLFSQPAAFWEQIYEECELDLPCDCESGKDLITLMIASLKTTLRLGRSEKVKSMIIGQSDLVSTYELNKPDLLNCTMFFLGQNVARGIEFVATDRQNKKELREQLAMYQEKAETDPRYRYYCLVSTHFCKPFLALMPPENFYSQPSLLGEVMVREQVRVSKPTTVNQGFHQPSPVFGEGNYPDLSDLGCTATEAENLAYNIRQGKNQTDSILAVFGCKKGGGKNTKYKNYAEAYKRIKDYLNAPKTQVINDIEFLAYQNFIADNG